MSSNVAAGLEFKRRVLIFLLQRGLRVVDPTDGATKLSDLLATDMTYTDIAGLGPWVVDVTTSKDGDMSTPLSRASAAARSVGSDWPVVIMSRRGHAIEDAYAVLPLDVMARIFSGQAPNLTTRPTASADDGGPVH